MKPPCTHHKPTLLGYHEENPKAEKGLEQRQCPTCLRWFFRGEFGKGWETAPHTPQANPGRVLVSVMKRDPKPGAKSYAFETVASIFDAVTDENIDEILRVFCEVIRIAHATRAFDPAIMLEKIIWTDD